MMLKTRKNLLFSLILIPCFLFLGCADAKPRVVLYCAQDKEFAEGALDLFTRRSGLPVAARYDTEADKSVSLYEELVREERRPRCDVHWNNEVLATIRLARLGLLEPYASPAAESYPPFSRAKDRTWQAFAERARILLVNTQMVPDAERPRGLFDLTQPRWKGKVAMARPQFGTSATQAACIFEVLGKEEARRFYRDLHANDVAIVAGNKQVAESVAAGRYALGLTDTDDAMAEVESGRPVAVVFLDRAGSPMCPRMGTLFIPNTVAIVRGCPNPQGARRLIDYLLSPEVEARLAQSASRQIPLNPAVKTRPPAPIETRATVKPMDVDFEKAADLWEEVQVFLRQEFGRP